jgi:hypothetical protein
MDFPAVQALVSCCVKLAAQKSERSKPNTFGIGRTLLSLSLKRKGAYHKREKREGSLDGMERSTRREDATG